jgi:hypothetical protein
MNRNQRKAAARELRGLVVLLVREKDRYGRPKKVEVVYSEERVPLQGGEEFWTAAVPEAMCKRTSN